MEEILASIDEILRSKIGVAALLAVGYVAVFAVLLRTDAGKRITKSLRLLFYSEPGREFSTAAQRRLIELEHQVELLRRSLSDKNLRSRREAIQVELEGQIRQELPDLVKGKLEELKALESALDSTLRSAIDAAVINHIDRYQPADVAAAKKERGKYSEREHRSKMLDQTIEDQMRSAGRLKAVMINLFVIFNMGILVMYIFSASALSDRAVTAIIGLYVSLAAFIVYIYRTSNSRSSVLLALREDAKKYFDAEEYLARLKPGSSPSERDVEVLKLIMLNRSEREKAVDHPYEVVFKGITNSNVLLKGGRIATSESRRRSNDG